MQQELNIKKLTRKEKEELHELLKERDRRKRSRKLYTYYPDEGPLRRELYVPHMRIFKAGNPDGDDCSVRAILAGNRIGKSEGIGGYETALHLTGLYPDWWEGKRFNKPITAWASGKTGVKTRDILQQKLLGKISEPGTGLIPGDCIEKTRPKSGGVPNAVETALIKHVSGGTSVLVFKSYAEERKSFEGEEIDFIWADEEMPLDIYSECLIRLMPTVPGEKPGHILCTFTPLDGMSDVVMTFLPDGKLPDGKNGMKLGSKFVIMATWDDAPHLSDSEKKLLWEEIPPYQREARSKGIPQLGSGAIYPIQEQDVKISDFEIPVWWPKMYGFDVGWNWTAAVWGAYKKEEDTWFIYSVYKRGLAEPEVHAKAIKDRGYWIPGAIDPASAGSGQKDGSKLFDEYLDLGLNIYKADNAVESGIFAVWKRLSTGKFKVFESCMPWFEEFRLYRRDEKGNVVKKNDHLLDATRYLIMTGHIMEEAPPDPEDMDYNINTQQQVASAGWY